MVLILVLIQVVCGITQDKLQQKWNKIYLIGQYVLHNMSLVLPKILRGTGSNGLLNISSLLYSSGKILNLLPGNFWKLFGETFGSCLMKCFCKKNDLISSKAYSNCKGICVNICFTRWDRFWLWQPVTMWTMQVEKCWNFKTSLIRTSTSCFLQ